MTCASNRARGRACAQPVRHLHDQARQGLRHTHSADAPRAGRRPERDARLSHQQSQDPRLAQQAVGDAATPRAKVEHLVAFVHNYITPSYSARPLTVLDLLKVRKGDCSNYAALFTALAQGGGNSRAPAGRPRLHG